MSEKAKRYVNLGDMVPIDWGVGGGVYVTAADYDALAQRCRELEKVSDDAIVRNTFLETECDDLRAEVERMRNPSDDMLVAGQEVWARGRIGALEDCEEAHAIYMAMIDSSMEATR